MREDLVLKGDPSITGKGDEMILTKPRTLGRTGLKVGPLGVAASYGAPVEAFEEAFERGCNYFYWGSKRRSGMRKAIMNLCRLECSGIIL